MVEQIKESIKTDDVFQIKPKVKLDEKPEMTVKGKNRAFEKKYDIKFTMGSELFANIISFLNEIGYDVLMRFRKDKVLFYIVDLGNTYLAHVTFSKLEFAEYIVNGIKDEEEKLVYVDTSIFNDMVVNENYPIDVYVDTVEEKKFYVINGMIEEYRRLNVIDESIGSTLGTYRDSDIRLKKLTEREEFQRIVVKAGALKNILNFASKKIGKKKEKGELKVLSIHLSKREINFKIEDELRGSSALMTGEGVMVYPVKNDVVDVNCEYFKMFGILKLEQQCSMYCNSNLPLVLEGRMGGGNIFVYLVIAPRAVGD